MSGKSTINTAIQKEAEFGVLPVMPGERQFGFWDAMLVLSGYGVATWCYTQGGFMASMLNFKQLTVAAFAGNIFALALYMLPVVFAVRYGIDMWQWLKAVFGTKGIRVMIVLIILINFPWFGVNADIFASTTINLFHIFGVELSPALHKPLGLLCVGVGTWLAIVGPIAIKWVNRLVVPALFAVGVIAVILAFTAVPMADLLAYQPDISSYRNPLEPYAAGVEASFAFAFSWCASTAIIPRLCRTESNGYWATVVAYGVVTPLFIVAGGALAIVMFIQTGTMGSDLALELSAVGGAPVALMTLLMVAFANIGTHGTGAYMWSVVYKSAFPRASFNLLVLVLGAYTALIVLWGEIITYFGAMISVAAYVYGPVMGLLFVDYFVIRKRRLNLRAAYEVDGNRAYDYTGGYNLIGFVCLAAGVAVGLAVFDPIAYRGRLPIFDYTTSSLLGFAVAGALYWVLHLVPALANYSIRDNAPGAGSVRV